MRGCLGLVPWFGLVAACGSEGDPDAGAPGGVDAGVTGPLDATVVDTGVAYDGGVAPPPDAGFADPATIMDSLRMIDGVRTQVRIRGTLTSTLPPIVFLNTGPMHGHEYLIEPTDFLLGAGGAEAPNRLLFFYDMRGTGRSGFGGLGQTQTASVTIEAHVGDLGHVLDFFDEVRGDDGPVDLFAHGYGAAVATLYLQTHSDRFRRAVFSNPYPSHVLEQADWGAEVNARMSTADRQRLAEVSQWEYCLRDWLRCSRETWLLWGHTWFCPENRDVFDRMTFRWLDLRPIVFFTVIDLRDREFDHRPLFGGIRVPVTVISGPCDPIPATAAAAYASGIPNAEHFVVPGTGHFTMTEDPARFQRIVSRALGGE